MIITSDKTEEGKGSEKQCRENPTSFHKTYYERPNNIPTTILLTSFVPLNQTNYNERVTDVRKKHACMEHGLVVSIVDEPWRAS